MQDQQTSTREQMVEKVARAMHDRGLLRGMERDAFDDLPHMSQSGYRDVADAAVEAVLPQVSTVEELEALAWIFSQDFVGITPLTVVWTPPTT